ncbi:ribosome biogenesis/translation initiation ATPase RLI [Candidatus Woesearchaeota archaeon]|nr:ribosome biogenesis/translation initiation ATPase RLI [Candidatus Woesearchaeota archaeon]
MTRIAVIEKEKCHPMACGGYLCIRVCPVNRTGQDCIVKGEDTKASINTEFCTGCGICPKKCPFDAIHIVNLPEALEKDPIHRYGENGFHLYSLPTPMFGKVVGVLGVNGIGKSTAIKILAGVMNPNLGKEKEDEAGYDELIRYFKGTEAQNFFEKVRDGKIRISYKPQQVELIPKSFNGNVRELLSKVDEKGSMEEIADLLDLREFLETDISKISGGELQRVAIAATVLKDANMYIFDEPTSFLDIKQRIKVSKFIRKLADEDTAVIVVEHDLIILDFMADLVNIMYGEKGAYGIVSLPKPTKAGINVFLEGYLKEDNIRFRDSQIKFSPRQAGKDVEKPALISWKGISKRMGDFHLSAEQGELKKRDVCGILGENGIGKTTFARILAGVVEKDSGEMDDTIKVSYKPQYLESESEEPVASYLQDAVVKFENQLIRPLNLNNLFDKKLSELSGGELQKVSIARCLSQDADLYLLDEPSAYLDVEQRLLISKIMRDIMEVNLKSCLVVDHDLLFIDYLSDDIIVFDGEPAKHGEVKGPFPMSDGMNSFLSGLNITMRRDAESNRPRINKPESQMDRKQKSEGKLYYS